MNKRGQITLTEVGYLLLALLVVGAILMAVSRGCDLIQSNKEKAQAEGTLTQLVNFLDSMKENEQSTFIIYSPKEFYLTSFKSFYQCSTDCLCICEDGACLGDKSYCKDIKKPVKEKLLFEIVGVSSLLINNQKDSYQFVDAIRDIAETESEISLNCSGELVPLTRNKKIKSSVLPIFELAQKYASEKGVQLVVTDAYRTLEVQQAMREAYKSLACNPVGSGMNCPHVIGCAIDVCLSRNGTLTDICYRTKKGLSPTLKNEDTLLLKEIMEKAGFRGISSEYWHFEYGLSPVYNQDRPIVDYIPPI
ncbi:MAG: hypothetical protein KKE23_02855 [Nanoarchaeota archaeon]|nr:hypothetical protein [Nanoarchaeota archaeon]